MITLTAGINRRELVLKKKGERKGYYVRITIKMVNPQNAQTISIPIKCMLDTGYSGAISMPFQYKSEPLQIGVRLSPTNIKVATGQTVSATYCFGNIVKIDDWIAPSSGIEAAICFQGNLDHGLIGLEIMKKWIVEFNGPDSIMTIYHHL